MDDELKGNDGKEAGFEREELGSQRLEKPKVEDTMLVWWEFLLMIFALAAGAIWLLFEKISNLFKRNKKVGSIDSNDELDSVMDASGAEEVKEENLSWLDLLISIPMLMFFYVFGFFEDKTESSGLEVPEDIPVQELPEWVSMSLTIGGYFSLLLGIVSLFLSILNLFAKENLFLHLEGVNTGIALTISNSLLFLLSGAILFFLGLTLEWGSLKRELHKVAFLVVLLGTATYYYFALGL